VGNDWFLPKMEAKSNCCDPGRNRLFSLRLLVNPGKSPVQVSYDPPPRPLRSTVGNTVGLTTRFSGSYSMSLRNRHQVQQGPRDMEDGGERQHLPERMEYGAAAYSALGGRNDGAASMMGERGPGGERAPPFVQEAQIGSVPRATRRSHKNGS